MKVPSSVLILINKAFEEKNLSPIEALTHSGTIEKMTDIKDVEKYLEDLSKEKKLEFSKPLELLNIYKTSEIVEEDDPAEEVIPEDKLQVYFQLFSKPKQIINIAEEYSYEKIKAIGNEIFKRKANSGKIMMPFMISRERKLRGKIIMDMMPGKSKEVRLADVYTNTDTPDIRFFGEALKKGIRPSQTYYSSFFFYRFESGVNNYVLLSKKPIKHTFITIRGMKVTLSDAVKTGYKTELPVTEEIIFVHSVYPERNRFKLEDIQDDIKRIETFDDLSTLYLGKLRHPHWFEKLLMCWLLSGSYDGYPLHLGMIGKANTGKSSLLEALNTQIEEPQGIYASDESTMAGLSPNYGKQVPDAGYAAKCEHLILVDELFAAIKRDAHTGTKGMAETERTNRLKSILEHKQSIGRSGKGEIMLNPTGRMFTATNPEHGLDTIVKVAQRIDNAFLSRVLWYAQTPNHDKFIIDRQDWVQGIDKEKRLPEKRFWAKKLFLCLSQINLEINQAKKTAIYEKYKTLVPVALQEVYRRYKHHILCLIDGIAKINYVVNKRPDLYVLDEDYDEADYLFGMIIASWNDTIEFHKLPVRLRVEHLELLDRKIFDAIDANKTGMTRNEVEVLFDQADLRYRLKQLEDKGVIAKLDNLYYPFWHKKVKEEKESKENTTMNNSQ